MWNGVGCGDGVVGTLLGPEGAGPVIILCMRVVCMRVRGWSGLLSRPGLPGFHNARTSVLGTGIRGRVGSVGEVGWLVVENCTVDASIFDSAPAHPDVIGSAACRWVPVVGVGGFVECL